MKRSIVPKLQMVPIHATDLPKWEAPQNLKHAASVISQLGRNMHEHAYLVGKNLYWVKKNVGHGKFLSWLKENVWFGAITARRMMKFADNCSKASRMLEYHTSKPVLKTGLPSMYEQLIEKEPVIGLEDELAETLRKFFRKWPTETRNSFFTTVNWVLNDLNQIHKRGENDKNKNHQS